MGIHHLLLTDEKGNPESFPAKMRMATKIRLTHYFPGINIGPYANKLNL